MPKKTKNKPTAKEKKKHIKEIMSAAIDQEELDKRKAEEKEKENKRKKIKASEEPVEDKPKEWWELPIDKKDFKTKTIDDKLYAQHKEWKGNIWIGPYDSRKELNAVIKSYVEESKKDMLDRHLENVHSVILN